MTFGVSSFVRCLFSTLISLILSIQFNLIPTSALRSSPREYTTFTSLPSPSHPFSLLFPHHKQTLTLPLPHSFIPSVPGFPCRTLCYQVNHDRCSTHFQNSNYVSSFAYYLALVLVLDSSGVFVVRLRLLRLSV